MASIGETPLSGTPEGDSLHTDCMRGNPEARVALAGDEIRKKVEAFYNLFRPSDSDRQYYEGQLRRLQAVFEVSGDSEKLMAQRNRYWTLLTRDTLNTPLGPACVEQPHGYLVGQDHLVARITTANGEHNLVAIIPFTEVETLHEQVLGAHIYRVGERTTHHRFALEPLWETEPRTSPLEIWYGDGPLSVAVCGGIDDAFSVMGRSWETQSARLDRLAERNRALASAVLEKAA